MSVRRAQQPLPIESREFRCVEEIDAEIAKLERRIRELEALEVRASYKGNTGASEVAASNLRASILDVFGPNSNEFREHKSIEILTVSCSGQ